MAASPLTSTPKKRIQLERFTTKQHGYRLVDISLSSSGNIAVCGYHSNRRTFIDLYFGGNSDSRDKLKLFYSKEFKIYSSHCRRYVSFLEINGSELLLTCIGDKIEIINTKDESKVLRSCRVNGEIRCLAVREGKIFIGLDGSKTVIEFNNDLKEVNKFIIKGIEDGDCPCDLQVINDTIFVCTWLDRTVLSISESDGSIITEYTYSTDSIITEYIYNTGMNKYASSMTVSERLGLVAVVWGVNRITVYSLNENKPFLVFGDDSDVSIIRIPDRDRMIITGDAKTGEIKMYDLAELFTYGHLKETLHTQIKAYDCLRLATFFALPKDQTEDILNSDTLTKNLFLALEEIGVIQPSSVKKLTEAFLELKINSCYDVTNIYQKTREGPTQYGRFLATLSAHLTASLPADLCGYFNITDEKKNTILSSQNPGLSLLLVLDEMEVIKSSDVVVLVQPFSQFELVQAIAKVQEYQLEVREENTWSQLMTNPTIEDKVQVFVRCLQNKIKSWYETMTPVPWKKSCRWSSKDLFVGSGLILTGSKAKTELIDVDPGCKLEYQDVLTHDRLKSESRLILEGEPGCGKTMLASQLAYDWAQGRFEDTQILVFLPLKFVDGMKLVFAIRKFYVSERIPLSEEDIEAVLNRGTLSTVILLDGFEEYNIPVSKAEGNTSEVHAIMSKVKYPNCKVVLTSRADYTHDLPACPMLKLGRFGEGERNTYIKRVFPEDKVKQLEIKSVIEDTPFIMELCSVPLLFVLAVHNIERMVNIQEGQIDRVTPFMDGMVETLCPPFYYRDRTQTVELEECKPGGLSIEKIAFSGLCKGYQQLSWPKDFMEENVDNVKDWIDAGVLVVEEGIADVTKDELDINSKLEKEPLTSGVLIEGKDPENIEYRRASKNEMSYSETWSTSVSDSGSANFPDSERESNETFSGLTAHTVALRIKFLHKVFQEWFAAKYLSSVIWPKKESSFREQLAPINPVDLHYVLRFTCYLCPPSCHIVINHLLKGYCGDNDIIPTHIMDCICLCYAEYDGQMGEDMKMAVSEICKTPITVQSMESRLLQQSKIAMLKFASQSGIPIMKLRLLDVIKTVGNEILTFNSGVTLDVLHTLRVIEVSRWDQMLQEEDYRNLVNFIASGSSIQNAYLSFPNNPPVLPQNTLEEITSKNITVDWHIGQLVQKLDPSKNMWMIHVKGHQTTEMTRMQVDAGSSREVSKKPSASLFQPGTIATLSLSPTKPEKLKGRGTELSRSTSDTPALEEADSTVAEESPVVSFPPTGWQDIPKASVPMEVIGNIFSSGGLLRIPETEVRLVILPNSLPKGVHQATIQLRIISDRESFKHSLTSFASNSTVVVELLPNHLKLQRCALLTLPHCLKLKMASKTAVKVFISHHEKDSEPCWEWKPYLDYQLDDRALTLYIETFCWVKYIIDDEEVLAKKIQVFAARQYLTIDDKTAKVEVGYYPDLPGAGEILRNNKDWIEVQKKPFLFLKNGKADLEIIGSCTMPAYWVYYKDEENTKGFPFKKISFRQIASSVETSCPFFLGRIYGGACFCVFGVSQGDVDIELSLSLKVKGFCERHAAAFEMSYSGTTLYRAHDVNIAGTLRVDKDIPSSQSKPKDWTEKEQRRALMVDRDVPSSPGKPKYWTEKEQRFSVEVFVQVDRDVPSSPGEPKYWTETEQRRAFMVDRDVPSSPGEPKYWTETEQRRAFMVDRDVPSSPGEPKYWTETEQRRAFMVNINRIIYAETGNRIKFLKGNLAGDWKDLGRCLDLTEDELIRFGKENKDDIGEAIYQMLLSWQRKNGSQATSGKLIKSLEEIKRTDLAEKLTEQLRTLGAVFMDQRLQQRDTVAV